MSTSSIQSENVSLNTPIDLGELKDVRANRRRPKIRIVSLILVAILAITTVIGSVLLGRRSPEVLVVDVQPENISRILAVSGRVEAAQTVLVSPQFVGRITEIVRSEGDRVKKGEVLARLEDVSALSDVLQQRAMLSSKTQELSQAKRDLARTSFLVSSGALALAEMESARLLVSRAQEEVRRLSAVLWKSRAQLGLLAPFDGTIVRRAAELGQIVGPQSTVFEIATVDTPRVSAQVDERYVHTLRKGMSADILQFGSKTGALPASVSYISSAVDPQIGAATVRFAYLRPPTEVLIGMSVDVNINVETLTSVITIPKESVGGGGDQTFVLVATDGRVMRRAVSTVDWPASQIVVLSGLKKGELVLVDPKGVAVGKRVRTKVFQSDL